MAEWTTEGVRLRILRGFAQSSVRDRLERQFSEWLAAHDAEVRVQALEDEARWLNTAHNASHDKGYSQAFRDGFGSAIGWVELHIQMLNSGQDPYAETREA